jgi:hypothetical protein
VNLCATMIDATSSASSATCCHEMLGVFTAED